LILDFNHLSLHAIMVEALPLRAVPDCAESWNAPSRMLLPEVRPKAALSQFHHIGLKQYGTVGQLCPLPRLKSKIKM